MRHRVHEDNQQRPRRGWPLLVVLSGVALLMAAVVGWSTHDRPTGLPATVGGGIATELAAVPPLGATAGLFLPPSSTGPSSSTATFPTTAAPGSAAGPASTPSSPRLAKPSAASDVTSGATTTPTPESTTAAATVPPTALPAALPDPSSALLAQQPFSPPTRLQIPTLGVDAGIVPVGVDPVGDVAIPNDIHQLGWYRYGPVPGASEGSIVVVGHVDSATQGIGAFFYLAKLTVGDTIMVTSADGQLWQYTVVGREAYPKTSVPLDALFSTIGAPRLTLITCGGQFDKSDRSYLDNIVITARPS